MNCQLLNQSTSQLREVPSPETSERVVKQIPFTHKSMNHNAIRVKWKERNERKETQVWMKRADKKGTPQSFIECGVPDINQGTIYKASTSSTDKFGDLFLVVQPSLFIFRR